MAEVKEVETASGIIEFLSKPGAKSMVNVSLYDSFMNPLRAGNYPKVGDYFQNLGFVVRYKEPEVVEGASKANRLQPSGHFSLLSDKYEVQHDFIRTVLSDSIQYAISVIWNGSEVSVAALDFTRQEDTEGFEDESVIPIEVRDFVILSTKSPKDVNALSKRVLRMQYEDAYREIEILRKTATDIRFQDAGAESPETRN